MPRSAAISRHGVLLPSCSMAVTIISSPGWNRVPSERVIWNVRLVMFGPKTISRSELAWYRSAIARCAWCTSSVASMVVRKWPPMLALVRTRQSTMRSITGWGTWVPAGLSR